MNLYIDTIGMLIDKATRDTLFPSDAVAVPHGVYFEFNEELTRAEMTAIQHQIGHALIGIGNRKRVMVRTPREFWEKGGA